MKQTTNTKNWHLQVFSPFCHRWKLLSFPVAGSKCAPVQHMVNIFAAVSWSGWGVGNCLLRKPSTQHTWNRKSDGFPGSMIGSLLWTCLQEM